MPDVNVLVAVFREDPPHHDAATGWLRAALGTGHEQLGLTASVITGYVRIVTHPKIFKDPTSTDEAIARSIELLAADRAVMVSPGPRYWPAFVELCGQVRARGSLISDAAHAASAIEAGATWVTFDRDFTRFPGLRCELL